MIAFDVSCMTIFEKTQLRITPSLVQPRRTPDDQLLKMQFVTVTYSQTLFSFSERLLARKTFVSVDESVHCTDVKGERFSGRILSVGGRFCPKRLVA